MSYKDFIEKFVESSSLSDKDSKLLALEMESDFYAKEKDLILNNETNTMKKIEDDFGDKDKLAEQMFLAHHKYLNIPILGPLFYFKAFRITLLLIVLFPINYLISDFTKNIFLQVQLMSSGVVFTETSFQLLPYIPGYLLPYIILAFIWAKRKTNIKNIIRGSIIYSVLIVAFLILIQIENTLSMAAIFSTKILFDFLLTLSLPSVTVLFLVLFTLAFRKLIK